MLKDDVVRANLIHAILGWMNGGQKFPDYLQIGKLILLSKEKSENVEASNTRPIAVLSHVMKVVEKAILLKLEQNNS